MLARLKSAWSSAFRLFPHLLRRGVVFGSCPICQRKTFFYTEGRWLRDQFRCIRCFSIPRWRAVVTVLERFYPDWRELAVHESSPGGAASAKLARECKSYSHSHWFPDVPPGESRNDCRCENLEALTFPDRSFDLFVTQDVFEHVLDPGRGFAEVARVLRPGGAHVFTVPWFYWKPTLVRAARGATGTVEHLAEPDYHGNPIDPKGSLVVTEWGSDMCDSIHRHSGLATTAVLIRDRKLGLDGEFLEVFVSRQPSTGET